MRKNSWNRKQAPLNATDPQMSFCHTGWLWRRFSGMCPNQSGDVVPLGDFGRAVFEGVRFTFRCLAGFFGYHQYSSFQFLAIELRRI